MALAAVATGGFGALREPAIVLANDYFQKINAKTSHALVRSSLRYEILAVVDPACAGRDAGEVLDGEPRGIPIRESVAAAIEGSAQRPTSCIVGVATAGGILPPDLRQSLVEAIESGLTLVNGLHQLLADDPEIGPLAESHGVTIVDVRKPRPTSELQFWSGAVANVSAIRVPVLGTDCATGKRTTCVMLRDACAAAGIRAEMVYTGQSGWLQGHRHGFIFDSTPNDFVCGELERAIVACDQEEQPQVIFIEGQSGLRNPSGPCGSEFLLSAAASGVVLQHPPGREHFIDSAWRRKIPSVEEEVDLIRMYGVEVWAVTLNQSGLELDELRRRRDAIRKNLDVPVVLPLVEGVDEIVDAIRPRLETVEGAG